MRLDAASLRIEIETVGYLKQDNIENGGQRTVLGVISFQTSGDLPPSLRLVPEGALKAAAEAINGQIVQLAVRNFEAGAKKDFASFLSRREPKRTLRPFKRRTRKK